MSVVGIVLATILSGPARIEPVIWLNPRGSVEVAGKEVKGKVSPGTRTVRTPFGLGLDLAGGRSGLLLNVFPALALTRSMTVSTWIYLRSYVNSGGGAQILFRGDDRNSLDPYSLVIHPDGTVNFGIGGEDGWGACVTADIPLKEWVHVTGSFESESGELRLYLAERLVSTRSTVRRPFYQLDGGYAPGVGIGNVQNELGPHNQPLDGILADLRLYSSVLEPSQAGWRPGHERGAP